MKKRETIIERWSNDKGFGTPPPEQKAFVERQHPRDRQGRFADKPGAPSLGETPLEDLLQEAVGSDHPSEPKAPQKPGGANLMAEEVAVPRLSVPGEGARAWAEDVKTALDKIDNVHEYPSDTPVADINIRHPEALESIMGTGLDEATDGLFSPRDPANNDEETLALNADMDAREATIIHELGHKFDYDQGVSKAGAKLTSKDQYASGLDGDPSFQPVMRRIEESKAWGRLNNNPAILRTGALPYFTGHAEAFARAYAQWIRTKNGKPNWPDDKVGRTDLEAGVQWEPDDFKPIGEAFDNMMKEKGLLL